jgi:hypothetical protein
MKKPKRIALASYGRALLSPVMGERLSKPVKVTRTVEQVMSDERRKSLELAHKDDDGIAVSAPNFNEPLQDRFGNTIYKRSHFGFAGTLRRTLNIQNIVMPSGSNRMVLMFDDETCISIPGLVNKAKFILNESGENITLDCADLAGTQWATIQYSTILCVSSVPGEKYILQIFSPSV